MSTRIKGQMAVLFKVLSRFKLNELKDLITQKFSSVNWEDLLCELKEKLEPLNSKSIAQLLILHLKNNKYNSEEFDQIIDKFTITEISTHSHKRTWRACKLTGEGKQRPIGVKSLKLQVIRHCQQASMTVAVSVVHRNSMYWLLLKEKKRPTKSKTKKKNVPSEVVQYKAPVFIAASVGEPYLFIPYRYSNEDIIECVSSALNYTSFRCLPLSDNKIDGMLKTLRATEGKAVGIARLPEYKFECAPVAYLPAGGIDFTQRSERQRYVDEYFGENPPVKKTISFVMQNVLVTENVLNTNELKDLEFPVSVTITSDNVWSTVKSLIVEGVIQFPPPAFYHKAMLQAKDTVKLKACRTTGYQNQTS